MTQVAYLTGTFGTIKGGAVRYDAPNGKEVNLTDPDPVDRPLLFTESGFVAFHSAHDDLVYYVKKSDIVKTYIAVPDDVLISVTQRVLAFINKSVHNG